MRLRLSQAQVVLAVAAALLLATNLYFGISYATGQDQKGRLAEQYHRLEGDLRKLVASQEGDSSANPDEVVAAALAFPKNPPGLELTDVVVRAARETGVEVLGLHTSAVEPEQIGNGTYRRVKISIRLRAAPPRLTEFFNRLERGGAVVPTMVIDNLDVVRSGDNWEASLDLFAYSQGT